MFHVINRSNRILAWNQRRGGRKGWAEERAGAFLNPKVMSGLSAFSLVLPDRAGGISLYMSVSCIHEAFWHHSLFCYEIDHSSALLPAAIWCSGKGLSKGEENWGAEAGRRKRSNSGRWDWFIFAGKGASYYDWWREGGCLGIGNCLQSRQTDCWDDSHVVLVLQAQSLKISIHIFVILVMLAGKSWERLTALVPQHRISAASARLRFYISLRVKSLCPTMCA